MEDAIQFRLEYLSVQVFIIILLLLRFLVLLGRGSHSSTSQLNLSRF